MSEQNDAEFLRNLVEGCDGDGPAEDGAQDVWIDKATADRVRKIAAGLEDAFHLTPHEFALLRQVFLHTGGTHIDMGSTCVEKANELRHAIYERTGRDFEVLT